MILAAESDWRAEMHYGIEWRAEWMHQRGVEGSGWRRVGRWAFWREEAGRG